MSSASLMTETGMKSSRVESSADDERERTFLFTLTTKAMLESAEESHGYMRHEEREARPALILREDMPAMQCKCKSSLVSQTGQGPLGYYYYYSYLTVWFCSFPTTQIFIRPSDQVGLYRQSSSRMAADCAIVGAAGFLGRRLTETLESLGSTCVRLDVVVEEEGIVGCDLSSPRCFPQLVRSFQGVRCVFLVASYGMVGTDLDLDVRLPPRAPTLTLAHSL